MIPSNYVYIVPKPLQRGNIKLLENFKKNPFGEKVMEDHSSTHTGYVIGVPNRLIYHGNKIQELKKKWGWQIPDGVIPQLKKLNMQSISVDTEMEVQVNDIVFFHPTALKDAANNGLIFMAENMNNLMPSGVFMKYDLLDCALRGNKIIPLNGKVLIDVVKQKTISWRNIETDTGTIRYVGKPCKHRRSNSTNIWAGYGDDDSFKRGDEVLFRKHSKRLIDNELAPTLNKNYYVMSSNQIVAKKC